MSSHLLKRLDTPSSGSESHDGHARRGRLFPFGHGSDGLRPGSAPRRHESRRERDALLPRRSRRAEQQQQQQHHHTHSRDESAVGQLAGQLWARHPVLEAHATHGGRRASQTPSALPHVPPAQELQQHLAGAPLCPVACPTAFPQSDREPLTITHCPAAVLLRRRPTPNLWRRRPGHPPIRHPGRH